MAAVSVAALPEGAVPQAGSDDNYLLIMNWIIILIMGFLSLFSVLAMRNPNSITIKFEKG